MHPPAPLVVFANYWPLRSIIAPPAQIREPLGGGASLPAFDPAKEREGRRESKDGLKFSISGDPSDRRPIEKQVPSTTRVGEFTDRWGWRTTKGAQLRRRPSSEGLRVQPVFEGGIRETASPRPLHRSGGQLEREFGGVCSGDSLPEDSPPFFAVLSDTSSSLPPMSCLGIRVHGLESRNPTPPAPRPFSLIGGFLSPSSSSTMKGTPLH